jgi:hypothetical protein
VSDLLSRSTDGGKTWSKPTLFPHTVQTQVYPGSLTTLADGRLVHTWNVWFSQKRKPGPATWPFPSAAMTALP